MFVSDHQRKKGGLTSPAQDEKRGDGDEDSAPDYLNQIKHALDVIVTLEKSVIRKLHTLRLEVRRVARVPVS